MPAPAFASGSSTSESAAARLETRLQHAQAILRLAEAEGADGITCDQAELALGYTHQSCSARVHELGEQCGALRRAGVRRQTRSRRMAEVYVLADGLTAETAMDRYKEWCSASRGATTGRRSRQERAVIAAAKAYAVAYKASTEERNKAATSATDSAVEAMNARTNLLDLAIALEAE